MSDLLARAFDLCSETWTVVCRERDVHEKWTAADRNLQPRIVAQFAQEILDEQNAVWHDELGPYDSIAEAINDAVNREKDRSEIALLENDVRWAKEIDHERKGWHRALDAQAAEILRRQADNDSLTKSLVDIKAASHGYVAGFYDGRKYIDDLLIAKYIDLVEAADNILYADASRVPIDVWDNIIEELTMALVNLEEKL